MTEQRNATAASVDPEEVAALSKERDDLDRTLLSGASGEVFAGEKCTTPAPVIITIVIV